MSDYNNMLPLASGINNIFQGLANRQILTKQREYQVEDDKRRAALILGQEREKTTREAIELTNKQQEQASKEFKKEKDNLQRAISVAKTNALKSDEDPAFAFLEFGKASENPEFRKTSMKLDEIGLGNIYKGNINSFTLEDVERINNEVQRLNNMGIPFDQKQIQWTKEEIEKRIQNSQNEEKKRNKKIENSKKNIGQNPSVTGNYSSGNF